MSAARKKSKLFAVVAAGGEEKPNPKQTLYQKFKSSRDLDNISDYSSAPMRVVDAQPGEVKDVKPILRAVQLSAAPVQQLPAPKTSVEDKENQSVVNSNVLLPVAEGRPRKKSVTFEDVNPGVLPPLFSLAVAVTVPSPAKPSATLFSAHQVVQKSTGSDIVRPFATHPLSIDPETGIDLTRETLQPTYRAPVQPPPTVLSPIMSPIMLFSQPSRPVAAVRGPGASPMSMSSLSSDQQIALASAVAAIIRPTATLQIRNDATDELQQQEEELLDMDEGEDDSKPNFFFNVETLASSALAAKTVEKVVPPIVEPVTNAAPAVSTVRTELDRDPDTPIEKQELSRIPVISKPEFSKEMEDNLAACLPVAHDESLNMCIEMDTSEDKGGEIQPKVDETLGDRIPLQQAADIVMAGQSDGNQHVQNVVVVDDTSPPEVANPAAPFDTTPPQPINRMLAFPGDTQVQCNVEGSSSSVQGEPVQVLQPAPLFRMKTEQLHGYGKSTSAPIPPLPKDSVNNTVQQVQANKGLPRTPMVVAAAQKALLAAAADLINDTSRSFAAGTTRPSQPLTSQSEEARATIDKQADTARTRTSQPGPSPTAVPAPSWNHWKKAAVPSAPSAAPAPAPAPAPKVAAVVAPVMPILELQIPVAQIVPQQAPPFGYMPQMPAFMYPPMPQWQYPGGNAYFPPYYGYGQPPYPMMQFAPPNAFNTYPQMPTAAPLATAAPLDIVAQQAAAIPANANGGDAISAPVAPVNEPETIFISLDESSLHSSDCDLIMPQPPAPSPSIQGTTNTEEVSICTTQQLASIAAQQHQYAMEVAHYRTAVPALTPLTEIMPAHVESVQEPEMSVGVESHGFVLAAVEKPVLEAPAAAADPPDFEFDAGDYPAEEDMVAGDALLSLQKSKSAAAPSPVAHGLALSVAYDAELDIVTPSQDWLLRVPSICSTTRDGPGNGKAVRRRRRLTAQLAETTGINEHSFNSVLCTLGNVGAGGMCPPDLDPSPDATIIYPESGIRTPAFPALSLVQLAAPGKFKLRYPVAINDCEEHMRGPLYPRQHESPIGWDPRKGHAADTESSPMQWSSYLSESPVMESPAKRRRKTSNV
jgi:hypothetical protein